ncbi:MULTISPECIES: ABC transporter ATP-binding protein [unclassified Rhizobium]|uniref:ABC transporter ATP-binding protein n=1 Tax=unclassified Rhizobium TaxID=2613769 RepID=UPI000BD22BD0|nr:MULTISPECIES: ABC transporter ATP-binding protein [unclassified Rhizobium]MDH7809577.1 branched-chain amino acid transport system ATP-binding protein [Rhizobium sp. AN67]MDQ4408813.1 ABC transporter ATP-binding protein [Rhizobium sp. AN63]SOD50550.1 amino acid/amide ABC transporter ATP-binding protein 2, HAAT family [Rhizobium sp. AN6A]
MSIILDVSNIEIGYGEVLAVRGVNFEVPSGAVVTIVGANGAGKTTLLAAIAGLRPSTGAIRFDGRSLHGNDTEDRVEKGLCLVPEQRELFGSMTVADNLLLGGFSMRRDRAGYRKRLAEVYDRFPRLAERRDQLAWTLSGGERQMLALGRALMSQPRLLMLDEPSLGLAPLLVREIFRMIVGLRDTGVSVLLVEQNARAALEIADYAYVMESGQFSFHGSASTMVSDARVVETYFGKSALSF